MPKSGIGRSHPYRPKQPKKRPDFKETLCSEHVHVRPVHILVVMRKIWAYITSKDIG